MSFQGDLSEISKSTLIEMSLRRCMRRLKDASQMHHCWLGNLFFRSTVIVWNKLDPNLWSTASVFKKSLLKFIRPSPNGAFNYHNCKGIKNLTSLQLGLNHLILWIHLVPVTLMLKQICIFIFTAPPLVSKDTLSWAQLMTLLVIWQILMIRYWLIFFLLVKLVYIYHQIPHA